MPNLFDWLKNAGRRKPVSPAKRAQPEPVPDEVSADPGPLPEFEVVSVEHSAGPGMIDSYSTITAKAMTSALVPDMLMATLRAVTGETIRCPARWDYNTRAVVIGPVPVGAVIDFWSIESPDGRSIAHGHVDRMSVLRDHNVRFSEEEMKLRGER